LHLSLRWEGIGTGGGEAVIDGIRAAAYDGDGGIAGEGSFAPSQGDSAFAIRLGPLAPGPGYTVIAEAVGRYFPPGGSLPDSGLVFFGIDEDVDVRPDGDTEVLIDLAPFVPVLNAPDLAGDSLVVTWTEIPAADEYLLVLDGTPPPIVTTRPRAAFRWIGSSPAARGSGDDRFTFRVRARNRYALGATSDTVGAPPPAPPPFAVVALLPDPPEEIPVTDPVFIEFNRPVDLQSLIPEVSVVVTASLGDTIPLAPPSLTGEGEIVEIRPLFRWEGAAEHEILLTSGVTDLDGDPLDGDPSTPEPDPFTTEFDTAPNPNKPPAAPLLESPPDGSTGQPPVVTFIWGTTGDPNGDPVRYDVYGGTRQPLDLLGSDLEDTTLVRNFGNSDPGALVSWFVEAVDPSADRTPSETWSFRFQELPVRPGNLYAAARTETSVTIGWEDMSADENLFIVERRGGGSPGFQNIGTSPADTPLFEDTGGLSRAYTYDYRVFAVNDMGRSDPSETFSVRVRPPAPRDVAALWQTPDTARVSWTYPEDDPDLFELERSLNGAPFVLTETLEGSLRSWVDMEVTPTVLAIYRLRALVPSPPDTSEHSAEAMLTGSILPPEKLFAAAPEPRLVELSWVYTGQPADSFGVIRRELPDGLPALIAFVPGSASGHEDDGVAPGRAYGYQVFTLIDEFVSFPSAEAAVSTPLVAPHSLTATPQGPNEVHLEWAYDDPDPLGFLVDRRSPGSEDFFVVRAVDGALRETIDPNLLPMETYAYRVRAYSLGDTSDPSDEVEVTTASGTASPPRDLAASSPAYDEVFLDWAAPDSGEVDSYRIERRAEIPMTRAASGPEKRPQGDWETLGVVGFNIFNYTHRNIPWRSLSSYRVRAINLFGASDPSNEVSQRPQLPPPTDFAGESSDPFLVQVSWLYDYPYENLESFRVERKDPGAGDFAFLSDVPDPLRSFLDTTVEPDMIYSYRLRAEDAFGPSAWTAEIPIHTPVEAPGIPQNVVLDVDDPYGLTLSWEAGSGGPVQFYEIARQRLGDDDLTVFTQVIGGQTSYKDSARPGRRYRYAVRAKNVTDTSAFSETVEAWTTGWRKIAAGGAVGIRSEMAGVFDEPRDRLVVFGGKTGILEEGEASDSMWQLTFADSLWTSLDDKIPVPPPKMYSSGFTHDRDGDRFLIHSGTGSGLPAEYEYLYALDLRFDTWTFHTIAQIDYRRIDANLVYRSLTGDLLMTGGWVSGFDGLRPVGVLVLSESDGVYTASVERAHGGDEPAPFAGHVGIYNEAADEYVVFGGEKISAAPLTPVDALVTLKPVSETEPWVERDQAGDLPGARTRHAGAFDPDGQLLYVFGGVDLSAYLGDLYVCSVNSASPDAFSWTRLAQGHLAADLPPGREGALLVLDADRNRLVLFGGRNATDDFNDLWIYQLGAE
jgi:hypothetical protein